MPPPTGPILRLGYNWGRAVAAYFRWAVRRERPGLAVPIERATAAFERVAYGKQDAAPGDVDALRAAEQEAKRA